MAITVSPDGRYLTFDRDGTVTLHPVQGNQVGAALRRWLIIPGTRMSWAASGDALAYVGYPGSVPAVLRLPGLAESAVRFSPVATALAMSPEGTDIALAATTRMSGSMLQVLSAGQAAAEIGRRLTVGPVALPGGERHIDLTAAQALGTGQMAWSPDGKLLAVDTQFNKVLVLTMPAGVRLSELTGHTSSVMDLTWLGPYHLATASADRTVRIWQISGHEVRRLEGDDPFLGLAYVAAENLLIGWGRSGSAGWGRSSYTGWDLGTGKIRLTGPLDEQTDSFDRPIAATPDGYAIIDPRSSRVAFESVRQPRAARPPASVSTYANAKVLLLGDSGVGKSGLALVLAGKEFAPTESTHARRVWPLGAGATGGAAAERDVLLWDLAGQPGYRIVHQLHLRDAAAALLLFDSRSETTPLAGVGYWARALRQATAGQPDATRLPVYLVAARTDRGVAGVSDERITEVAAEFGFRGWLPTSAREGWGVDDLRATLLAAIDWTAIPVVTSTVLFAAARSFVLGQKAAGILLTPLPALHAAFLTAPVTGPAADVAPGARTGGDLLDADPGSGQPDAGGLREVFEGCVARLESAGLVRQLAFGDLVLLQPELIDAYAGAIVNAAQAEPDGLGSLLESRVLAVDFALPADERIRATQQEKLLIIATLEELSRHELMLREETDQGISLVFPSALRVDPPPSDVPAGHSVEFAFEGPVPSLYATLVVRLARSDRFTRRGAWQGVARFEADTGGLATIRLAASDEGRGTLWVSYEAGVPDVVQVQFERFIEAHLERRAVAGTVSRARRYACPDCGAPFGPEQVEGARRRGRDSLICPADEIRVSLDDPFTRLGRDADVRAMESSADTARAVAAASSVILGKEETTDFDVFLCHNNVDKPAIREVARRLRELGILPWLDADELRPGQDWQQELERRIGSIRSAAVFVGPSGLGPWQDKELRAFLNEFIRRDCPVIPVLLPGATPPALPVFLANLTWVDLAADAASLERLVWGITGRKPPFHPGVT